MPTPTVISPGAYGSGFLGTIADTTNVSASASDTIVGLVTWYSAGGNTLSSVSGGSLTWTIDSAFTGITYHMAVISAPAPAGLASSTTITATFSSTVEARNIRFAKVDGLATVSPADGAGQLPKQVAAAFSIPDTVGTSGDFQIGAVWLDFNTGGVSSWTGATKIGTDWSNADGGSYSWAYKTGVASGSQPMAGTAAGADVTGIAVAYKVAAAGSVTPPWLPFNPGAALKRKLQVRRQASQGVAPSASTDATATPPVVAATTSIPTPTITSAATVAAAVVAALVSIAAPTVSTGVTISPAVVAAVASVPAPALHTGETVTASVVSATTTVASTSVSTGETVAPSVVNATTSIPTPTVTAGGNATAAPSVVAVVTSVGAPTISTGETVTAAVVNATTTIPTPAVTAGGSATAAPAVVSASTTVGAPAVSVGSRVSPAAVSAVTTVATPTITSSAAIAPGAVTGVAAIGSPVLHLSTTVSPATVTVVVAVPAPSLTAPPDPNPVTLTITETGFRTTVRPETRTTASDLSRDRTTVGSDTRATASSPPTRTTVREQG